MTPEQLITLIGICGSLIGAAFLLIGTLGKTRADAKTALDARIDARVKSELDRVYARLDEVEDATARRTTAFTRILRAIAEQWPDSHGPDLNPEDIREIEDTIPPRWVRRRLHPNT